MAQAADTGAGGGAPFVKFTELGDTLVGAFGGGKARQQQDYETKSPKFKDDGKPLQEEVMHFVAMPGTTAKVGSLDDPQAVAEATHVRYAVSGFKWGQVIDQRKALPAYSGFAAGTPCSGDVYTIRLVGWSTKTDNPAAAAKAGFTVVEGRIVLRTQQAKDEYVLAKSRTGGNVNVGKDFEITIRRPNPDEKRWEQAGDDLFASKPWERTPEPAVAGGGGHDDDESEPF